jgi:hypothetical protein
VSRLDRVYFHQQCECMRWLDWELSVEDVVGEVCIQIYRRIRKTRNAAGGTRGRPGTFSRGGTAVTVASRLP